MTRLTLHGIIVHRLSPWNTNAKMMVQHRNTKNTTKLWHLRTPNPTQIPCLNGPYNTSRRRHHPSWTCDGGGGTRGACLPSWSAWPNGASCLQNKDFQCERQMIQWTLKIKHARNDDIMNVDIHDIYTDFSIHNAPTIVQWTLRKDVEKQHTVLYPGLDTSPWNTWNIVKSYCCPLSRCHGTALLGALAGRGTTTTLGCHGVWGATQSEQKRERTNTRYDERVHSSKNKNGRWEDTGLTNCKKTYWIYEDAFNFTIHYYTPQYKRFNIGIGNIIRHDMTNGIAAITMTEGDEYRYMYEYGKDTRLTITARNRALFGKIHSKYKYGIIFPNTWYDSKFHLINPYHPNLVYTYISIHRHLLKESRRFDVKYRDDQHVLICPMIFMIFYNTLKNLR